MIQNYNSFGNSWSQTWGGSWGKTPVADALERSGVTRLWMYELYAASIEEDHKKRGINQVEPAVVMGTVQPALKKPSVKRIRRAVVKLEPKHAHKPLPRYAPAFVKPIDRPSISEYLAELSPLPVLKDYIKETAVAKARKIKRKRKQEDELLLLLAA